MDYTKFASAPEAPDFHELPQTQPMHTVTNIAMGSHMIHYGPDSQIAKCPHCDAQMMTTVKSKATTKTHMIALLLCLCLCWPCVCIPFCCASCQNRVHYCSNCQAFLGTYTN